MPRPKRTKIVSQAQQRAASKPDPPNTNPTSSRIKKRKTSANGSQSELPEISDPVTSQSVAQAEPVRPRRSRGFASPKTSLARRSAEVEVARSSLSSNALPEPNTSHPRRALQDISHQVRSPNVHRAYPTHPWSDTGKALDDDFEEYLRSSSPRLPPTTISRPPSATKIPATPSVLSVAKFRPRPRQHSILRMVQQDATNTEDSIDDTGEDLTLGTLERPDTEIGLVSTDQSNQRRPLSGTKRKASALDSGGEIISVREDDPEELPEEVAQETRDSSPDIPLSTLRPEQNVPFKKTPPPRRRRLMNRKQSSVPEMPVSSPPISASSPQSTPPSNQKVQQEQAAQSKHPQRMSRRGKADQSAAKTLAPTTASLKDMLPKSRIRLPELRKHDTFDIESSSDIADAVHEEESEQVAEGQDADTDPEQDSEYHHKPKRKGRRPIKPDRHLFSMENPTRTNTTSKRKPMAKSAKPPNQLSPKPKSSKKTYGRQSEISSIDRENDESGPFFDKEVDDNETVAQTESSDDANVAVVKETIGKSKELAAAKKKFEEVDDWQLSFESCDVGGQSSSPWR